MNKAKDLRDQTLDELELLYNDSCKTLFLLKNEIKIQKKVEQPHRIRYARKDIARLLTVMTEKRRQQAHQTK